MEKSILKSSFNTQIIKLGGTLKASIEKLRGFPLPQEDQFLVRKFYTAEIQKSDLNSNERIISSYISTQTKDRGGDIIDSAGWDITNYKKNPVVQWSHKYSEPPIGKSVELRIDEKGIHSKTLFADYPFADLIYRLYQQGFMHAFSVGYLPMEYASNENGNGIHFMKQELIEYSCVPVPANPEAVVSEKNIMRTIMKSQDSIPAKLFLPANCIDTYNYETQKSVVPNHEPPKLDENLDWDADRAIINLREWAGGPDKEKLDWEKYANGFAWFNSEDKENFAGYKLPHHDVVDGELKTHWRGVAAGMAALLGARGGVDVPADDRKGIYNHLANHYEQYEKEPPEFRTINSDDIFLSLKHKIRNLIHEVLDEKKEFQESQKGLGEKSSKKEYLSLLCSLEENIKRASEEFKKEKIISVPKNIRLSKMVRKN